MEKQDLKIEPWRNRCRQEIDGAIEEAQRLQHSYIGVEHLFIALIRMAAGISASLIRNLKLDPVQVRDKLRLEIGNGKGAANGLTVISPRLLSVFHIAAENCHSAAVLTEMALLKAIFQEGESLPVRYLKSLGHQPVKIIEWINTFAEKGVAEQTRLSADFEIIEPVKPSHFQPEKEKIQETPAAGPTIKPQMNVPVTMPTPTLDQWGRDLAKAARLGKLSEAIGREEEIEQIIIVLARTQKSNPLLLGEAGVGKTAIVEGLALRIAEGNVPPILLGKRIVELDMGGLVAGTNLRGQFETRIKQVVTEATQAAEVILFIDEIHTLVGAGSSSGDSNDAAQMLKPALARGDISCIGATTQDEYARHIRKDPALERRFSPITIKEMTPESTLKVLEKVSQNILGKHAQKDRHMTITPDALKAAVTLTNKYVKDRQQPDKSIDAIDIACARAVIKNRHSISSEDVAQVISEWTGIPVGGLTTDEQQRLLQMEETLTQLVIGQGEAIRVISKSVRAAMAGMKKANRPIGVFLFIGPSGVGKTKLAKELARFLFASESALIRFDMNEYQEKHSLSNMIGAARGYVDSEKGGQLTEALRRRPYSVVLLDEIEKAHPDIFNLFLSVFDDGRITDSQGRTIDCANAVFILTSNIGHAENSANIGFTPKESGDLRKLASSFLKPELVNRITEVVCFNPLGRKELSGILEQIFQEKIAGFKASKNITITIDEEVKNFILAREFDPNMGARPLERAVENLLVHPLVDAIFQKNAANCTIHADLIGDTLEFNILGKAE